MAGLSRAPRASLTMNRHGATILGTAGGKPIHVLVRRNDAIPPGRYQIAAPTVDPIRGRTALATGTTPQSRNILAAANTANLQLPRNQLSGGIRILIVPTSLTDIADGTSNTLAVVSGYEVLMDALAASDGGVLEVIG